MVLVGEGLNSYTVTVELKDLYWTEDGGPT